ncbi:MAG: polysaccharide deacetylase family protein [Spirochaetaceae bacterium]|nr:polysaccharide deacetylase family protein [Spirochaetaceae bacterium]
MKKLGYILLISLFASCATPRGAVRDVQPETGLDHAAARVKKNGPEIGKYFALDENGVITVKADMPGYEAVYDLSRARQAGDARFEVPFSVTERGTGSIRYDWLLWTLQEDSAGILLAFDDNYQEVWEAYLDLFDRFGAKATFFVQGRLCSFCVLALSRGHDVGYHTLNHLNLPKVSREVFDEETLSAVEEFRAAGVPLRSFAYPYGLSEPWMHEELLRSFTTLRGYGVTFRVYDIESFRNGYVSSKALDNLLFKRDEDFEAAVAMMFRTLKFIGDGRILPLTTHTIADEPDWGIKPRRLEYLLQTASDLGLKFYRYCDVQ